MKEGRTHSTVEERWRINKNNNNCFTTWFIGYADCVRQNFLYCQAVYLVFAYKMRLFSLFIYLYRAGQSNWIIVFKIVTFPRHVSWLTLVCIILERIKMKYNERVLRVEARRLIRVVQVKQRCKVVFNNCPIAIIYVRIISDEFVLTLKRIITYSLSHSAHHKDSSWVSCRTCCQAWHHNR